jgi:hypothetical protein
MALGDLTNMPCFMLTKGPRNRIHAQPWTEPRADQRSFYSDDAEQLASWLRAGRGPTCPNSAELVDAVQALIDEG